MLGKRNRFSNAAWAFVLYLLGVILFGAWVRITHSGAGCGSHWPTCHGEIIPLDPSIETMIEFTHRLTSGMCGIFGLGLLIWAFVRFRWTRTFWAVVVTMFFVVLEAAIGAGLVLNELVESDDSVARAIIIALHLVNTLFLTGAASLAALWSTGRRLPAWSALARGHWRFILALLAILLTSMTGAITALGDTLFPVDPALGQGVLDHVREDLSHTSHFLVRLRIVHPMLAIASALYLFFFGHRAWTRVHDPVAKQWALALMWFVGIEVGVGMTNIALAAPGWVQIIHLLVAQGVWICALLTTVATLSPESPPSPSSSP